MLVATVFFFQFTPQFKTPNYELAENSRVQNLQIFLFASAVHHHSNRYLKISSVVSSVTQFTWKQCIQSKMGNESGI